MVSNATCSGCGSPMLQTDRFCTSCGRPAAAQTAAADTHGAMSPQTPANSWMTPRSAFSGDSFSYAGAPVAAAPTQGNQHTPPGQATTVSLAHGEVIKRVHEVGRIQRGSGWLEGTLVITDARILYHARAKNFLNESTINREIQLADVRGIALSIRKGMSPMGLVSLIIMAIIGWMVITFVGGLLTLGSAISSFGMRSSSSPFDWFAPVALTMMLGVIVWMGFMRARATEVILVIYSKDIDASPISFSGQVGNSTGAVGFLLGLLASPLVTVLEWFGVFDAADAAQAADLERTRSLYHDLGALILDLQKREVLGAD